MTKKKNLKRQNKKLHHPIGKEEEEERVPLLSSSSSLRAAADKKDQDINTTSSNNYYQSESNSNASTSSNAASKYESIANITANIEDNTNQTHEPSTATDTSSSSESSSASKTKKIVAAPWMIIPPLVFYVLSSSMTFTPFQQIIILLVCDRLNIPNSKPDDQPPFYNISSLSQPQNYSFSNNTLFSDPYDLSSYFLYPTAPASFPHSSHLSLPSINTLFQSFKHYNNHTSPSDHDFWSTLPDYTICVASDKVQKVTSWWSMMLSLASNVPALLATPLIGVLSDKYGRKIGMALPVLGSIFHTALILLVSKFQWSLWFLVIGNLFQAFLGSFLVLEASAFAYLADTSELKDRSSMFGKIEAFIFMAFMLGPYVGGQLTRIPKVGVLGVFMVCIALLSLVFLHIVFVLPESRKQDSTTIVDGASTSPARPSDTDYSRLLSTSSSDSTPTHHTDRLDVPIVDSNDDSLIIENHDHRRNHQQSTIKDFILVFKEAAQIISRRSIRSIALFFFSISVGFGGMQFIFLFTSHKFGWDSFDMGKFLLVLAIVRAFYMGIFIPKLISYANKKYIIQLEDQQEQQQQISSSTSASFSSNLHDRQNSVRAARVSFELFFIRLGMLFYVIGLTANAFVLTETQFYIVGILEGVGAIAIPLARGLISKSTSPDHQGKLFSAMALIQQSTGLISPLLFGYLYRWSIDVWPGALFIGIAICYLIALMFTFLVWVEDLVDHHEF